MEKGVERIGIVGIGAMGNGIAKNLLKAGYGLSAYARDTASSRASAAELKAHGAGVVENLCELFGSVDTLVVCVPASSDVERLLIETGGLLECGGSSVKTVLDFSTSHPESTRKIHSLLKSKGIGFLDTPMTGSVREAAEGTIRIIVGGDRPVFEKNRRLLESVSELVLYAGPSGAGNLVKLANNYLSILDQAMTAQVSLVLEGAGIAPEVYNEYLGKSSANSGGFRLMMNRILNDDFATKFKLGLALKDIGYCRDVFDFPMTELLYELMDKVSEAGFKDRDIGTIYKYLKNEESARPNA